MIVHTVVGTARGTTAEKPVADARPLYIAPDAPTRVDLDGPALRVTCAGKSEQLFPLRRLSRVCSAQRVDWASEAMLGCARMGITVIFVDDTGRVVARLLGAPGLREELRDRLTEFLMLPQAEGMYRFWLGNMRRRAAFWAGSKLGVPREQRDPRSCRQWINRLAGRYAGTKAAQQSQQWLRATAYLWMQGHLQDLGFGAENELGSIDEPLLARDLTEVLMWYLEPARVGWLKARYLAARAKRESPRLPQRREVFELFESRALRAAVRGREITSCLHRWLIHET
jgi:hypothetical protein